MNFEEIEALNQRRIAELKEKIGSNKVDESKNLQLRINEKIEKLFQEEGQSVFFKLTMEDSITLLEQIMDKEAAKAAYLKLIAPDEYSKLIDDFEI